MNKILIKNELGESVIANVIRYFMLNGKKYMIYSLNEVDGSNYIKLYAIELNVMDNTTIGVTIEDENWVNVINLVKKIVNIVQSNTQADVDDINPNSLISVNLKTKRPFKIDVNMLESLQKQYNNSNLNIENQENETVNYQNEPLEENTAKLYANENNETTDSINDYYEKYNIELKKNQTLTMENEQLKNKLSEIEKIIKG